MKVNLPAGHTIKYEYGEPNSAKEGEVIYETDQLNSVTDKKNGYHRERCEKCGLILTDWEKHSYTEYVNSKEGPNKFEAKCECGLSFANGDYDANKSTQKRVNQ